ncbi:MAG: protein kinase [Myxococcales bacterium]|nr:protein kinase [Myxococcales bacterium]
MSSSPNKPPRPSPVRKPEAPAQAGAPASVAVVPASVPEPVVLDAPVSDARPAARAPLASLVEQELVAGRYRLLRPLSEGGMGTLWLAHNEGLDIECALKVIRADIGEVEREYCGGRLLQEARAAARLGHPAIVRVTDVGRTDKGEPFLVMELLTGEDLGAIVTRRGKVDPVKSVQTILPIIHALSCAHEKGIIHRDVKPENIFLARNEDGTVQPKLIDFGIAKLRGSGLKDRLTAVGAVVGTPGYMSPEQARGDESDVRADVWAICIILYELMAGEQPFRGANYNALMRAIVEHDPPTLTAMGVGDPGLSEIIRRGMAKKADERWLTMRQLGQELAEWLLEQGYDSDLSGTSLQAQWFTARESRVVGDVLDNLAPPARRSTPRDMRLTPGGSAPSVGSKPPLGRSSPRPRSTPVPGSSPGTRSSRPQWTTPGLGTRRESWPSDPPAPSSGPGAGPAAPPALRVAWPSNPPSGPRASSVGPVSSTPAPSDPSVQASPSQALAPSRRRPWLVGGAAVAVVAVIVVVVSLAGGRAATSPSDAAAAVGSTPVQQAPATAQPTPVVTGDPVRTPSAPATTSAPVASASATSAASAASASAPRLAEPPVRPTPTAVAPPPPPATTSATVPGKLKQPKF